MSDRELEFTADSVDEAVAKGLEELGVGPGDVIVEVIEEASRGVFGLGARPARVRLKMLRPPTPPAPPPPPVVAPAPQPQERERTPSRETSRQSDTRTDDNRRSEHGDKRRDTRTPKRNNNRDNRPRGGHRSYDDYDQDNYPETYNRPTYDILPEEEIGEDGRVAREVLQEILGYIEISAEIGVTRADPTRPGEDAPWLLNIEGRDSNALIGRKGETLAALQYITRLIVSRKLERRINIVVDANGHKLNRSKRLRELAVRMADQAVAESRTITLEPMPPHERRMIHMALREREDVETKSSGEGDSRKVTIMPL